MEKVTYTITIINQATGRGRAFEVHTGSLDTLAKAVRTVAEEMQNAKS